jgi:hypothetical protein
MRGAGGTCDALVPAVEAATRAGPVVADRRIRHIGVMVDWAVRGAGRARARFGGLLAPLVVVAGLLLPSTVLGALPASIGVVVGKPIARQVFNHWMFVDAKSNNGANAPLIVPTDPPRFNGCLAQVRATIPSLRHTPTHDLRADCAQLFRDTSQQVLDLLIRADWQEVEATADGIVITAAQVEQAFKVDIRRRYPKPAEFRRYLKRSGETVADVKFRIRTSLISTALLKTEHLSADALEAELTRRFKPKTTCARYYVMSDCLGR